MDMNIPFHVILWTIYNGISIISTLLKPAEDRAYAFALAGGTGILSVALVAGEARGPFLTLEVARWSFMLGVAFLAKVVRVGPESEKLLGPLAVASSIRMAFAAVTWLYML
jgi:hypothetical protein